jgi:hypothetical protein
MCTCGYTIQKGGRHQGTKGTALQEEHSLHADGATAGGSVFAALDNYLKREQMRFGELFAAYDADRSGTLEPRELRRLVRELLTSVSEGAMAYFEVCNTPLSTVYVGPTATNSPTLSRCA